MIDLQDAHSVAESFLDREVRLVHPDVVLVRDPPLEHDTGYVFGWQSRAALEGSLSDTVVPATPIWVDRATGEARFASEAEQGPEMPEP